MPAPRQAQRRKVNVNAAINSGTYPRGVGEIKGWSYYSQLSPANDTATKVLFQQGLGGGSLTRLDQTNFPNNGNLPNSQKFEIYGIGIEYVGNAAKADADFIAVRKWLSTTAIQIMIQDKSPIFQARLSRLLGLTMGLFSDPTTTAEPVSYTTRENPVPFFKLSQKITITANTSFQLQILPGVVCGANQTSDLLNVDLIGDLITLV